MVMNNIGRKGAMMGTSAFFALTYLCLAAAQNVWMLFIGRFLSGMASGLTTIATPTYVSEVASPNVRGMLGSCFQLMVTVGVLFPGIIGAIASWRWISVACIAWCLLWSILLCFCPESPWVRQLPDFLSGDHRGLSCSSPTTRLSGADQA